MALITSQLSRRVDGVPYLDNVSCRLERGGFYVVVGPTLSGKTSLLRALAGLDLPDTGAITLDGRDQRKVPVWKRSVSMVYQQFINYPHLSVFDNIAFPLRRRGMGAEEVDRKVRQAAQRVALMPLLDRMPAALSGGQQQRMALARSLAKDDDLLLLDEPLVNLDYKLREQLREEFLSLFAKQDRAIMVYATTEPNEALLFDAEVLVMHEGRLLQSGPAREVYARPANVEVARIFSDPPMNLMQGILHGDEIRIGHAMRLSRPRHFDSLPNGNYTFGIHPGDLAMHGGGIAMQVDLAEINGSETCLHASRDSVNLVLLLAGVHGYVPGDRVEIAIDGFRLFAFAADGKLAVAPSTNQG
ncbi:MAG TPA: ABC transporter ATP-binding protein [Noviherbaspirillum sp.]|nr:ABC transporter ATP-binding protein [Noviherbaspirillum sp.]